MLEYVEEVLRPWERRCFRCLNSLALALIGLDFNTGKPMGLYCMYCQTFNIVLDSEPQEEEAVE